MGEKSPHKSYTKKENSLHGSVYGDTVNYSFVSVLWHYFNINKKIEREKKEITAERKKTFRFFVFRLFIPFRQALGLFVLLFRMQTM